MVKKVVAVLVAGMLMLLLSGCGDARYFALDNPTSETIEVKVDGTLYVIPAKSEMRIGLQPGSHRLISEAVGEVEFHVYPTKDAGGIINPTLSIYIKVDEVSRPRAGGAMQRPPVSRIEVNGVSFEGSFTRYDSFYILPDWTYGVHENFPGYVASATAGPVVSKVFSCDDFIAYYEQKYNVSGYYENNLKRPEAIDIRASLPPEIPEFDHPEIQAATQALRNLAHDYISTIEPQEQQRLLDMWYEASYQLAQYDAKNGHRLTEDERRQLSEFRTAIRQVRSMPLLLIRVIKPAGDMA